MADISGAVGCCRSQARPRSADGEGNGVRGIRAACDYCHAKRVKCVRDEGSIGCQQCEKRDMDCHFSPKEKTGPKPRDSIGPKPTPGELAAYPLPSSPSSYLPPIHTPAVSPKLVCLPNIKSMSPVSQGISLEAPGQGEATPSEGTISPILKEWTLLRTYQNTVGQLLPFVGPADLDAALRERQAMPILATTHGPTLSNLRQAEVCAAMSIGALVSNDPASYAYHMSHQFHLGGLLDNNVPEAAPPTAMMALYWECLGDSDKKDSCIHITHNMLRGSWSKVSAEFMLCMEYLDCDNEPRIHPEWERLPSNCKALNLVSCVLRSMTTVLNPNIGRSLAERFSWDLSTVTQSLKSDNSNELPLLVCSSMHALLLVMLGMVSKATEVLDDIPGIIESNPMVIKALPHSWDATLIAISLAFILGRLQTHGRMLILVDHTHKTSDHAHGFYCLPKPGSSSLAYLNHYCYSSDTMCPVVRTVGRGTCFGRASYYP